jgi:signal transduction histidine kinase
MKRFWLVWIGFSLCVAATATAMTWMTCAVVRLERAEAEARRKATLEDNVRLALWKADATLAPLVTQESLAPWIAYRPLLPGRQQSPFLAAATPNVLVHFQFEPDGRITSPEAPSPESRKLVAAGSLSADRIRAAEGQIARLAAMTNRRQLAAALPQPTPEAAPVMVAAASLNQSQQQRPVDRSRRNETRQSPAQQAQAEFDARNNWLTNNGNTAGPFNDINFTGTVSPLSAADIRGVPMTPLWIDGNLILARRVLAGGNEWVQGSLLDLASIREMLADAVGDLLPAATFEPAPRQATIDPARMLAVLPLRIVPGELPADDAAGLSPLLLSLFVAWGCLLATAVTVACLLAGILRLSNRRASFVTAVTHELRTPLTTFQMYVEMLAENMVPDPAQHRQYLKTLQAEAARLTHMVENVLAYARLERGRTDGRIESIALGQLLDRVQGRLVQRAESAGMQIVVEGQPSAHEQSVRVNVSAVEQILFNLVDNACKYAAAAEDKRIHVELRALADGAEIGVRDHGPGLPLPRRSGWFHSFSKSAQEAAHSAPGIGLGLALSRRLARHMGGDLRLVSEGEGACFVLALKAGDRK